MECDCSASVVPAEPRPAHGDDVADRTHGGLPQVLWRTPGQHLHPDATHDDQGALEETGTEGGRQGTTS